MMVAEFVPVLGGEESRLLKEFFGFVLPIATVPPSWTDYTWVLSVSSFAARVLGYGQRN